MLDLLVCVCVCVCVCVYVCMCVHACVCVRTHTYVHAAYVHAAYVCVYVYMLQASQGDFHPKSAQRAKTAVLTAST